MTDFKLGYHTIRNLTPKGLDSRIYRGVCEAPGVLGIPTDKNVRDAIEKGSRLRKAMRASIADNPQDFVIKNSGITMLADAIDVNDSARRVVLRNPSIINGAQTQAVIKWWADQRHETDTVPLIQFEILILGNTELEQEVSVTRNSMNKVDVTSIMGYQGHFDELIRNVDEEFALRETDEGEDPVKLLQVTELLDPTWEKAWSTYSSKAAVLTRYAQASDDRREYLHALAPDAWKLYQEFRHHKAFLRCGLHSNAGGVTRDANGTFLFASDALIFPIIYAHRELLKGTEIHRLSEGQETRLVLNATKYFSNNAKSDVSTMGRKRHAYDDLRGRLEWLNA